MKKFYVQQQLVLQLVFAWDVRGFALIPPTIRRSFSTICTRTIQSRSKHYSSIQGEGDLVDGDTNTSIEARAIFCAEHLGKCSKEEVDKLTDALQEKREAAHLVEGQKAITADDAHWKLLQDQLRKLNDIDDEEIQLLEEPMPMLKEDYKEMIREDHLHVVDIREEEKHHREEDSEEALTNLDVFLPEG
jgi:hypothetical protein